MDNTNLSFGQRVDDNGLVELWLTHGCLDWIKKQDWLGKTILEFGAGLGDAWLARRCKHLYVVERSEEWLTKAAFNCQVNGVNNIRYFHRPCNEGEGKEDMYCEIPDDVDIIINDDAYRTDICERAIKYFNNKGGGILVCDNWIQSFVWISPKAEDLMEDYDSLIWEQADHTDNDGVNKWKSAVFFINPNSPKKNKPKQNRIEISNLDVPKEWQVTSDWGSHLPLLFTVMDKRKTGITEFGCGLHSTKSLYDYCKTNNQPFESFETNIEWYNGRENFKEMGVRLIKSYGEIEQPQPILFIDCAPGELRRELLKKYFDKCEIIIAHDTQPSAEFVYGMGGVLSKFKHRIDFLIQGQPMTTAVSNTIDITKFV